MEKKKNDCYKQRKKHDHKLINITTFYNCAKVGFKI